MTRRQILARFAAAAPAAFLPTMARAEGGTPSAEEILGAVLQSMQRYSLTGSLRTRYKSRRVNVPFSLALAPGSIQFQFAEPAQSILINLAHDGYSLREGAPGAEKPVKADRMKEFIRNTDVRFEDIAFRFLYWKNPVLLGEGERIKLQETWKLRLTNPDEIGPYGVVLLWVDQNSGAMLKLEGYDRKGRLTKKYEVSKVQKSSQNEWMLEEMKVETIDPNTGDTVGSPTYMEVEEAKRK
ncbi:MAG: outer membrane lipoprotein-sorting protein [Verrucomicrobiales bacterium]